MSVWHAAAADPHWHDAGTGMRYPALVRRVPRLHAPPVLQLRDQPGLLTGQVGYTRGRVVYK